MIEQLVEQIRARFAELEAQMSDPDVIADRQRYAEVGREYRQLKAAHDLAAEYSTLKDDLEGARELLAEGEDAEMRAVVDEVVNARVYSGIHFRKADDDAAAIGRTVARDGLRRYFERD